MSAGEDVHVSEASVGDRVRVQLDDCCVGTDPALAIVREVVLDPDDPSYCDRLVVDYLEPVVFETSMGVHLTRAPA